MNWELFLDQHNIPYVTRGPNVTKGHVAIKCPFCADDPSEHMSISTEGRGWRCWRNQNEHRGSSPVRLIVQLLHCSYDHARALAGSDRTAIPANFLEHVMNLMASPTTEAPVRSLKLPNEFREFRNVPSAWPFISYLKTRGLRDAEILRLTHDYDIRYAVHGRFHGRIIFPVFNEGRLVSWTGRALSKKAQVRYSALTPDPDKARLQGVEPAVGPVNNYLLWYDKLMTTRAKILLVTEGPFDALLMNLLGKARGIVATCLFTNSVTENQVCLLSSLVPRFERRYIMLDYDMSATAMRLQSDLANIGIGSIQLPDGVKDPALLRRHQLDEIFA